MHKLKLTPQGADKIAHAHATSEALNITHFAVGDGVLTDTPTALTSERYRASVLGIDKVKTGQYEVICIVPPHVGGFVVREFGVFDDTGTLIWAGALPPTDKPTAQDVAVDFRIKAVVQIDNPQVQIIIDPNAITATRAWATAQFIPKSVLELLYPIGYKYWTHKNENPAAAFSELFGYETHWRRLEGVHLLAVKDGTKASRPMHTLQATATDAQGVLDTAYTSYLFERYDPSNLPPTYDGTHRYGDGTTYQ